MTEQGREEGRVAKPVAGQWRRWRGVAVAGVIATAGTLALVALRQPAGESGRFAVVEQQAGRAAVAPDPLMVELIRCRGLPPQADDPACRAAWAENQRRFFGETGATRVPGEPLPASAPIPTPASAPTVTER